MTIESIVDANEKAQPDDEGCEIRLTRGMTAIVDKEDFERVNTIKWYASENGGKFYAANRNANYPESATTIYMHRFIMGIEDSFVRVDHKDGNGLNNRRYNLRVLSHSDNLMNRGRTKANKSGFKGVSPRRGKWFACIWVNGKTVGLGVYSTPEEAARIYDNAARKYRKDKAVLNFPTFEELI
jgi:hypothetical protein